MDMTITLSPADEKHPICLYFAGDKQKFCPEVLSQAERRRLVSGNPVAGARFFHLMISLFIKHVLGSQIVQNGRRRMHGLECEYSRGFYGTTDAYYGTVEQQGRLTLHLHMLLWIKDSVSPQQLRNLIMDPSSLFQTKLVRYLESCHQGELITGTLDDVKKQLDEKELQYHYTKPTETLPSPPPYKCIKPNTRTCDCDECASYADWYSAFLSDTDDILLRANVHTCSGSQTKSTSMALKSQPSVGCRSNPLGVCKARFPRPVFQQTFVDSTTGYLNLKKGESMMNTFTTLVSYLFRCNTDVTSLLSGTAVKAVVAYISDYISKTPLKTYVVFDTIRCIFERNSELIGGSVDRQEKARKIMTQIVNSLTSKLEIGAPLASLYLLQNPDHYTDHCFIPFYWTSYVHEARKVWHEDDAKLVEENDLLLLRRSKNLLSGVTPVFDYIYRPLVCEDICLYDWVCTYERVPFSRKVQQQLKDSNVWPDLKSHLSFDSQHPLHSTHGVRPLALGFKWVPNFLGPSLPRSNKGDREFYCASMLALFAPWRTDYDLKSGDLSWDMLLLGLISSKDIRLLCRI